MFKIEKNVPISRGLRKIPADDEIWQTLEKLKPGESFLVPGAEKDQALSKKISNRISTMQRMTNKKFETRFVEGGRRVWRKADAKPVA